MKECWSSAAATSPPRHGRWGCIGRPSSGSWRSGPPVTAWLDVHASVGAAALIAASWPLADTCPYYEDEEALLYDLSLNELAHRLL
jgi:hypothetical protein